MKGIRIVVVLEPASAAPDLQPPQARATAARCPWPESVALLLVTLVCGTLGLRLAQDAIARRLDPGALPDVSPINVYRVLVDDRPVRLTTTAAWQKVPFIATREAVRADVTLWRRMQFDDWDTVPTDLRIEGLDAMLLRHRHLLASPAVWDRMGPDDWDLIPQPIRAMAFRHMVEYWSGYYQVGAAYGIPRPLVSDTLSAIVMSESWFDHRAVNINRSGTRDLGVAQASDCARRRMVALRASGAVDVSFDDDEYFDPWKGTRFVALWTGLLLDEVEGDLDRAIGAYHRGAALATDARGRKYIEIVKRRRSTFIRNQGASQAWDHLWRRDLALSEAARPWLHQR